MRIVVLHSSAPMSHWIWRGDGDPTVISGESGVLGRWFSNCVSQQAEPERSLTIDKIQDQWRKNNYGVCVLTKLEFGMWVGWCAWWGSHLNALEMLGYLTIHHSTPMPSSLTQRGRIISFPHSHDFQKQVDKFHQKKKKKASWHLRIYTYLPLRVTPYFFLFLLLYLKYIFIWTFLCEYMELYLVSSTLTCLRTDIIPCNRLTV